METCTFCFNAPFPGPSRGPKRHWFRTEISGFMHEFLASVSKPGYGVDKNRSFRKKCIYENHYQPFPACYKPFGFGPA